MKHLLIVINILAMLVFVLVTGGCSSTVTPAAALGKVTDYRDSRTQPLAKDQPAPDFQLQMPDGTIQFLSDLQGKVVILNFWAVSCPYCVLEMPYLEEAYNQLSAQGVVILGINTGESEKTVAKFVTDKKLTFPIIRDPEYYASMLYGAQYLPTTFFIDKTGNIQSAKFGAFRSASEVITTIKLYLNNDTGGNYDG